MNLFTFVQEIHGLATYSHPAYLEGHGMVLRTNSLCPREHFETLLFQRAQEWEEHRARNPEARLWQLELSWNHNHPTTDFDRRALQIAREEVLEIAEDLRRLFPTRRFHVHRREEQTSFCQGEGVEAKELILPKEPLPASAHCYSCHSRQTVAPYLLPDAEFPEATFGACLSCGNEVLIFVCDEVVTVEPSVVAE